MFTLPIPFRADGYPGPYHNQLYDRAFLGGCYPKEMKSGGECKMSLAEKESLLIRQCFWYEILHKRRSGTLCGRLVKRGAGQPFAERLPRDALRC